MIINTEYKINSNHTNFKQGLTSYEINCVKRMGHYEYENIVNKVKNIYNINANVGSSNTVAYCLEQTAKIMKKAGFKLPKNFDFSPLEGDTMGSYTPYNDTVTINSNLKPFYNLEKQNMLEESLGAHHPDTKHFLSTYIHEFSHAAHYKNLCEKHGEWKGYQILMGTLRKYAPNDIIVGPMRELINKMFPQLLQKIVDYLSIDLYPPENGLYAKTSLTEYIAEYNTRQIALKLGDNFDIRNVPTNMESSYIEHPKFWKKEELEKELSKYKNVRSASNWLIYNPITWGAGMATKVAANYKIFEIFNKDINYTNGDIWQGNIDAIEQKSITMNNSY